MNKTVELVNQWGSFEEKYPDSSIEDFCRYTLANKKEQNNGVLVGGVVPRLVDGLLLKILGRITKLNFFYANIALKGTGLNRIEEFGLLLSIQQQVNPQKTEVIYSNLFELSSGTDILNRLRERGYISEHADDTDKRAKRLKITPAGEKVIEKSVKQIGFMAKMMLSDMSDEDKQLCVQLLKGVEIKFSSIWLKHKGMALNDIYKDVVGTKPALNKNEIGII